MVAETGRYAQRSPKNVTVKYILGICITPISYLCLGGLGLSLALQGPVTLFITVAISGAIGLWYLWKVPGWLTRWAYNQVGEQFRTSRATTLLFFGYTVVAAYSLSILVNPNATWSFSAVYPEEDIFQTTLMIVVVPYTYNLIIAYDMSYGTAATQSSHQSQEVQKQRPSSQRESVRSRQGTNDSEDSEQYTNGDTAPKSASVCDHVQDKNTTNSDTMVSTESERNSESGGQGNPLDYTGEGVEITTDPNYIGDLNLVEAIADAILNDNRDSLSAGRPLRLLLLGPNGSGKKTIIKTVAERYGLSLEILPPNENSPEIGFDNGNSIVALDNINEAPEPNRSLDINSDLLRLSGPVPNDSLLVGIYQGVSDDVPDSLIEQFDYAFAIQCPKLEHRKELIQVYLEDLPHSLDEQQVGFIASWTRGCTGGEIKNILCEGAENALDESLGEIQLHHIERAVIDILEEDPKSPGIDP